jgi:hypothetical protein
MGQQGSLVSVSPAISRLDAVFPRSSCLIKRTEAEAPSFACREVSFHPSGASVNRILIPGWKRVSHRTTSSRARADFPTWQCCSPRLRLEGDCGPSLLDKPCSCSDAYVEGAGLPRFRPREAGSHSRRGIVDEVASAIKHWSVALINPSNRRRWIL